MTDATTLFALEPKLTDRQQAVVEYVGANEPVRARAVGYMLHERRGCRFCRDGLGCMYAAGEGLSVLKALKAKGVLRLRASGWWVARPPVSEDNPLPEGF